MPNPRKFLLVDADLDGRVLLGRTLLRVFPTAAVLEVQDYKTALKVMTDQRFDAVVCHSAIGVDGETLVRAFRGIDPHVPILAISGLDRKAKFMAAGATRFLSFEEWLRVGTVVAEMLAAARECQVEAAAIPLATV